MHCFDISVFTVCLHLEDFGKTARDTGMRSLRFFFFNLSVPFQCIHIREAPSENCGDKTEAVGSLNHFAEWSFPAAWSDGLIFVGGMENPLF